MPVHSKKQAQVRALLFEKASIKILAKYSDHSNIFSVENAIKLPENIRINKHTIKLEEDKQPSFRFIYSLRPIKLETLKTYIETNLANNFIRSFKSLIKAPILLTKSQVKASVFM